ncbi:hypothetical protein ABZP36_033573 [Zizania latifolia]
MQGSAISRLRLAPQLCMLQEQKEKGLKAPGRRRGADGGARLGCRDGRGGAAGRLPERRAGRARASAAPQESRGQLRAAQHGEDERAWNVLILHCWPAAADTTLLHLHVSSLIVSHCRCLHGDCWGCAASETRGV